jgi:hypothetical protein
MYRVFVSATSNLDGEDEVIEHTMCLRVTPFDLWGEDTIEMADISHQTKQACLLIEK